jgi:hypothetical protein
MSRRSRHGCLLLVLDIRIVCKERPGEQVSVFRVTRAIASTRNNYLKNLKY